MALHQITAGFMPLTDSALLIAAKVKGFDAVEGVNLSLVRETSWANIRDRIAVGHFDAAHMLAPMPIASNLGLTPLPLKLLAPMALGLGGNAVTVSAALWQEMKRYGAQGLEPSINGGALSSAIKARGNRAKLQFAAVHPFSGHGYELRYWLAASGIDPVTDVDIVVVPPTLMADALRAGRIDGYCAGEPWNSDGIVRSGGHLATVKAAIWKSSPEKVLGVAASWADENPDALDALMRALHHASMWCGTAENRRELASILSEPQWIGIDAGLIRKGLGGDLDTGHGTSHVADFFVPAEHAATFPWQSHALWFYSQMVRWGQVPHSSDHANTALHSYRPDIYRRALKPTGVALPGASSKVEGALTKPMAVGTLQGNLVLGPDGFFDGRVFDPDKLDLYLAGQ